MYIYIYTHDIYTHDIYLYIDGETSKFYVRLYTSFFGFSTVSNDAIFEAPLQARWAKKSKRKKKPKRDDRTEEQKVGKKSGKVSYFTCRSNEVTRSPIWIHELNGGIFQIASVWVWML